MLTTAARKLGKFLTVNGAAGYLGVSTSTLRNWDRTGKLKARRHPINGYRLYSRRDLDHIVKALRTDAMKHAPSILRELAFNYDCKRIGGSMLVHADCLEWLGHVPKDTLHGIVTDPPYGVKEYDLDQLHKRGSGSGGVWRIPPSFDGNVRAPLPRFTALDERERKRLIHFFTQWAELAKSALRPGGHVFIATNAFLAPLVYSALTAGGLEFRGQIIRLVRTLRGGDRPKNAEAEFSGVSSLPRGCYEPWGLFRKPMLPGMKVSDCLREYQTGGLRRTADDLPFSDTIPSGRTPRCERIIANHPSLKPQLFLRQIVWASLPLGVGIIADPFAGSGSTVAAAEAMGAEAVGVERFAEYFKMAQEAVPRLARLNVSQPSVRGAPTEIAPVPLFD